MSRLQTTSAESSTWASQGAVCYRYNEVGRMVSVLDGKTDMETTYEYDPTGRVTVQAHPNGATTYFGYDLSGRQSLGKAPPGAR
jgi:YD repeat-containing protein